MASSALLLEGQRGGLVLDPRTKLFLLFTVAVFGLGGAGGAAVDKVLPFVLLLPYLLLLLASKWRWAAFGLAAYAGSALLMRFVSPYLSGVLAFVVLGSCAILNRFLPSILMGAYLMSTTTVSEFTAAMQRMHVSEKVIIPLSVMFRFFPTVADEAASIGCAMRMRDVRLGGKNAAKAIEYRMVPLMTCCARIGEELSAAALTRGLGGTARRTNICQIGFRPQDCLFLALCVIPWALLVADVFFVGPIGVLL
ncbi:MAG: energy-coupling factor transporter transmembrane component T [Coriobacteriales bacterium]|nr:energy-coupling factor transporter transmembrane component T [Coriobacteriales bacterium]